MKFVASPGIKLNNGINGDIRVPGDKSISHRSIMLGAIAEGDTHIHGFLEGEDALATLAAFRSMGVSIEGPENGEVVVHGVGLHGLSEPQEPLYLGNSGTSMRLLAGLLAGQSFPVILTGDASLTSRPMERIAAPLRKMGANIQTADKGRPPIVLGVTTRLTAIDYVLPVASAQVKSCVLLAGLYADGKTTTVEPVPTRDHTERMLRGFAYDVERDGAKASLQGGGSLQSTEVDVPADISSAAFFIVAATITENSDLLLRHVGVNPTRTGIIDILKLMGANIELSNKKEVGGEPVADIRVRSSKLKGINIPRRLVPLAIDEFPVIFVAAACAQGETVLTGAEELRVKESDRIQVMVDGLLALGVDAVATTDGAIIRGKQSGLGAMDDEAIKSGVGADAGIDAGIESSVDIKSHDDHRVAMSFAVASLISHCEIVIHDCDNVATSFPNFVGLAKVVGLDLQLFS